MALYTSRTHQFQKLDIVMTTVESLWVEISSGTHSVVIANIYRPPSTGSIQFCWELEKCLKVARRCSKSFILLGDFNAKHSSWLESDNTDHVGEDLHSLLEILGLNQYVAFTTHMHQGAIKACLDLAISSFESESVTTHPLPPFGAADYVMVKGSIHISDTQNASANIKTNNHQHRPHSNNCNNSTHWYWTNYNTSSLRSAMAELSLTPMRDRSDPKPVTTFWNHGRSAVLDVATWYCSTSHNRLQRNSHQATVRARPWISPELLKEIKEIYKLHRKVLLTQAQEHWRESAGETPKKISQANNS